MINDERINLILLDIDLGREISGPEAARQIFNKKNIPIIFLSANSEKEYFDEMMEIPCFGCVLKASGEFVLQVSIEIALRLFEENRKSQQELNLIKVEEKCQTAANTLS